MRKLLLLALATGALHAALIRGTVVENQTGRPLARALVVVRPVTGTAAEELSARTNVYGAFEFPPVAGGAYLLTASRRAFAPIQYGQKRWNSAGVPVLLEDSAATYLTIRLPRYGAVAGTVVDENEVGLPEHDVVVYTNTRPPKLMARGKTDDRGMYRISGLDPGSYLVRTTAKLYDDGGYLPTFGKETATVDQAYAVEVTLDEQVEKADIRPLPGRLFTVAVQVISPGQTPFTVTLGFAVALTAAAVLGKQVCSLGVLERGLDRLSVGLGMIPRGEVGLIFANVGAGLRLHGVPVIGPEAFSAVVVMVMITTLVTPPLLRWSLSRRR